MVRKSEPYQINTNIYSPLEQVSVNKIGCACVNLMSRLFFADTLPSKKLDMHSLSAHQIFYMMILGAIYMRTRKKLRDYW